MKITMAFAVVAVLGLAGCASYNQVMIGPDGSAASCDSYGAGLLGMATANSISENCIKSRRSAGYLEMEKAGAVGMTVNDELFVLRVVPHGPASDSGIMVGDRVKTVNGVPIKNEKEFHTVIFGPFGQSVKMTILRGEASQDVAMVSRPWPEVNGAK